ncbi:hypothetical protein AGMMS49525_18060 [Bacteroidia bacterium]|nr:hypothetical protein AGMMS49525_18060 [Bacteroidia bacterium]
MVSIILNSRGGNVSTNKGEELFLKEEVSRKEDNFDHKDSATHSVAVIRY